MYQTKSHVEWMISEIKAFEASQGPDYNSLSSEARALVLAPFVEWLRQQELGLLHELYEDQAAQDLDDFQRPVAKRKVARVKAAEAAGAGRAAAEKANPVRQSPDEAPQP